MGWGGWPVYGEDIGSAIQDVETIVAKIKKNIFDKQDLIELFDANNVLLKYLLDAKNENENEN